MTYKDPDSGDIYDMLDTPPSVVASAAAATTEALSFDTSGKLVSPTDINTSGMTIGGGVLNPLAISIGGASGGSTQLAASFAAKGDIDGIDMALAEAEFVSLTGPSGSGKSTLLNIIGLLERPTAGELTLAGERTVPLDDSGLTPLLTSSMR